MSRLCLLASSCALLLLEFGSPAGSLQAPFLLLSFVALKLPQFLVIYNTAFWKFSWSFCSYFWILALFCFCIWICWGPRVLNHLNVVIIMYRRLLECCDLWTGLHFFYFNFVLYFFLRIWIVYIFSYQHHLYYFFNFKNCLIFCGFWTFWLPVLHAVIKNFWFGYRFLNFVARKLLNFEFFGFKFWCLPEMFAERWNLNDFGLQFLK